MYFLKQEDTLRYHCLRYQELTVLNLLYLKLKCKFLKFSSITCHKPVVTIDIGLKELPPLEQL